MFRKKKCKMCKTKVYPPYVYPNRKAFRKVPLCQKCLDEMERACDELAGKLEEILNRIK